MKTRSFGCRLLLLSCIFAGRGALACGDKYFVTVQGTRYLLASLTSDSNVLIYNNPASEVPRLFASVSVENTLRKTGFLTTVVSNEADFRAKLAEGGWAIIIAGAADTRMIRSLTSGDGGTAVLPVVDNATPDQIRQLKTQYPVVLKATTAKSEPLLDVVFDAYGRRPKQKVQIARGGPR